MSVTTIIPIFDSSNFTYSTSVDGVDVEVACVWNTKTTHYHLTVSLRDGTVLIDGNKMVVGYPIFNTASLNAGLKGAFYLFTFNDTIEDIAETRENIAANFILTYHS